MKFEAPRFIVGDSVSKGEERGRVIERISQRTQRRYLTVQILTGSRRWQFEFPERGWRPQINWKDGTVAEVCVECRREFLKKDMQECFCRTCCRNNGHPEEAPDRQSSGDRKREHLPVGTKY